MTQRRHLERQRHSLGEIRDIMNSMKTLAYMETRKLTGFLDAQHKVVQSIEEVASDLLSFHPGILPEAQQATTVYILIGAERGFCGDFNHVLIDYLESSLQASASDNTLLIAVGHKLYPLLEQDSRIAAFIDGASVVEEVTTLLHQIVSELTALQNRHGVLNVYSLSHGADDGVIEQKLLPPFQQQRDKPPRFSGPPILNLSPSALLTDLIDQYLFATLHELLYTSLMAENYQRVSHLEGAVKHLEDESEKLARRCNALRREEIIEEIEVILLSAASLDER